MHNDNSEGVGVTIAAPLRSLMTGLVSLVASSLLMVVIRVQQMFFLSFKGIVEQRIEGIKGSFFLILLLSVPSAEYSHM